MNFASYNNVNWVFDEDMNIRQTYVEMLIERNQIESVQKFDSIFKCIKEKIFCIHENTESLTESESENLTTKYDIKNVKNTIDTLKKQLAQLHEQKIHLNSKVERYLNKYNNFLESVNSVTENMENLITDFTPQDEELSKLIVDRIEWYYNKLGIEDLLTQQKTINTEFRFLSETISKFSDIVNPSICQICYLNQVAFYINPCGHTLCESCKNKCNTLKNCHYCRSQLYSFNKLFL